MGWGLKLFVFIAGLASFGLGLWPVGGLCFLMLFASTRPRGGNAASGERSLWRGFSKGTYISALLGLLGLVAFAAGGTLSPLVLLALAAGVAFWGRLPLARFFSGTISVEDSVLLRSSIVPFLWYGLAEVKPGAEDFPRALSSYNGSLTVLKGGATYAYVKAFAFTFRMGEAKVLLKFREAASSVYPGGAYLLPLDSGQSLQVLRLGLERVRQVTDRPPDQSADLVVLESEGGIVRRWGAYMVTRRGTTSAVFPVAGTSPRRDPLLWEVLDRLGKRSGWPEPDNYSGLLDSVRSTGGEPVADRVNRIESDGQKITVHALGGEAVQLSRPQLRAIMSIYP